MTQIQKERERIRWGNKNAESSDPQDLFFFFWAKEGEQKKMIFQEKGHGFIVISELPMTRSFNS